MKASNRVSGMFKFFNAEGRGKLLRKKALEDFTSEEIVHLCQIIHGKDAHDIITYINTCRSGSKEISVEEVDEVKRLFTVKDVLES